MTCIKECPRADQLHGHEYFDDPIVSSPFPVCKLRNQPIIDSLPIGCPLTATNYLVALFALQERASMRIAARDTTGGRADLTRYEVCMRCNARLHPHTRYLRAMKRGAA